MTVGELRKNLESLPDDTEIILQKDSEGNGYSPMYCCEEGWYVPESTYSGEFYSASRVAEEHDLEEDQWLEMTSKPRAIVFAPIN